MALTEVLGTLARKPADSLLGAGIHEVLTVQQALAYLLIVGIPLVALWAIKASIGSNSPRSRGNGRGGL